MARSKLATKSDTQLNDLAKQPPWWKGAVIYQIYPRSFLDTSGSGVGDLKGIIAKMDYIRDLGVDAVWLSPFFTSPMADYGYDVSDYRDVDPIFGTLDDFDQLIHEAHKRHIKIIVDQVYSHTSEEHPWFEESRQDRQNDRSDWYVWADAKEDGTPPNNWQSVFGGPGWTWDARRAQYYMHQFLKEQPQLNVQNPVVQDALLDVARFWLDRGVDGFRLDAINHSMHDLELRDNPPSHRSIEDVSRPFDMQVKIYNQSRPEIVGFLERVRALLDEYDDRFTVAEVGGENPIEEMQSFTQGNKRLNTAYSFDFLYAPDITPETVKNALNKWSDAPEEGWPAWAFSNHDAPRAVTRWAPAEHREDAARLYLMLLLALRGNAFIYQGEELGLPQGNVPFEKLLDPEAIANWPRTLGRDGARTPMPWKHNAALAGFSDQEPWLPMDEVHAQLAVDTQEKDSAAVLSFARRLVWLRKETPPIRHGAIEFVEAPEPILCFTRQLEGETILCLFNMGPLPTEWLPDEAKNCSVLVSRSGWSDHKDCPKELGPYEGYWARLKK